MKKLVCALAGAAALALAGTAAAEPLQKVDDPVGVFTGQYVCGYETEIDPETGEERYKLDENGDKIPKYCEQKGYVSVGADGVVACNGNPELTRPDDGTPLQGYIWIGPAYAASNPTAAAPGNAIGAGNNHQDADGEATGKSPCP
jgi:hypothetical protein